MFSALCAYSIEYEIADGQYRCLRHEHLRRSLFSLQTALVGNSRWFRLMFTRGTSDKLLLSALRLLARVMAHGSPFALMNIYLHYLCSALAGADRQQMVHRCCASVLLFSSSATVKLVVSSRWVLEVFAS
jgi:hypothetical protein